jgi:hypothetical protein
MRFSVHTASKIEIIESDHATIPRFGDTDEIFGRDRGFW